MTAATMPPAAAQNQHPRFARAASWAYSRAGRGKHLARAHDVHQSTITRYRQGTITSPLAQAMALLAAPKTSPWPALTEAWVVVTHAKLQHETTDWLLARRSVLEGDEIHLNSEIQYARYTHDRASLRALRARQTDMVIELTTIETILDEREERGG